MKNEHQKVQSLFKKLLGQRKMPFPSQRSQIEASTQHGVYIIRRRRIVLHVGRSVREGEMASASDYTTTCTDRPRSPTVTSRVMEIDCVAVRQVLVSWTAQPPGPPPRRARQPAHGLRSRRCTTFRSPTETKLEEFV